MHSTLALALLAALASAVKPTNDDKARRFANQFCSTPESNDSANCVSDTFDDVMSNMAKMCEPVAARCNDLMIQRAMTKQANKKNYPSLDFWNSIKNDVDTVFMTYDSPEGLESRNKAVKHVRCPNPNEDSTLSCDIGTEVDESIEWYCDIYKCTVCKLVGTKITCELDPKRTIMGSHGPKEYEKKP